MCILKLGVSFKLPKSIPLSNDLRDIHMLGKGGLIWKLRLLPLVIKLFSHLNAAHNSTESDVLTCRMIKRQLRIEKWLRFPLPMKDGQGETPAVRLVVGSHPSPTPRNDAETN